MRKGLSIFLASLILVTGVGISFNTHYCGGKIHTTSIGILNLNELSCGMENGDEASCENTLNSVSADCCKNHIQLFQLEDEFNLPTFTLNINFDFVFTPAVLFTPVDLPTSAEILNRFKYKPPLIDYDIPVLIQSFLI